MNKQEIATLVEQLTVVDNKLNRKVVLEFKAVELKKIASYLQIKGYSKLLKKDLAEEVLKMLLCLQEDNKHRQNKNDGNATVTYQTYTSSKKLSREEFRNIFIKPLEKALGFKTYWNGNESKRAGLGTVGSYHGLSFTSRANAPIVLSLRANQQDTLRTLIHEYAHSLLHRAGTEGRNLIKAEKEIEAETVAKQVMKNLGIEYTNTWYIPHFKEQYFKRTGKTYYISSDRDSKVVDTIYTITKILRPTKVMAYNLIGKEGVTKRKASSFKNPYKYEVCCPTCSNSWKYKSKGKTVKNAHKYYCTSCGKDTLGKFIVKEL